jgi:tRNA A-37 threonylcarbamoyl transferase component Bud32
MADVWEAHDQVLSRAVAIKVLQRQYATDEIFLERFRREAIAAARLVHPRVVATFDAGVDGPTTYIVMELVRGDTLRQYLATRGMLPPWLAVGITSQIADALVHAHRAGIIHRDIKPANILLFDDGAEVPGVKVTDFGIAKAAESLGMDLTRTGMVLGTPRYLSPEQVQGIEPDARADVYALGVVTFEMLAGRSPFDGESEMAMAMARLDRPAPRLRSLRADVSGPLDALVAEMLATDPARRVPSATALSQMLVGLQATDSPPPVGAPGRRRRLGERRPDGGAGPAGQGPAGPRGHQQRPARSLTEGANSAGPRDRRSDASHTEVAGRGRQEEAAEAGIPDTRTDRQTATGARAAAGPYWAGVGPAQEAAGRAWPAPAGAGGAFPPQGGTGRAWPAQQSPGRHRPTQETPGRAGPPPGRRRRRRAPGLVVGALAIAGVVVAGMLVVGGHGGGHPNSAGASGTTVTISDVSVWIVPPQKHADNPQDVKYTYDGNDRTAWQTSRYYGRDFAGYGGEGLAIHLVGTQPLQRLSVTSPTQGWAASTYVAGADGADLAAWGPLTATHTDIAGSTTFDLGNRSGSWVLLWMTDTGPALTLSISELQVT